MYRILLSFGYGVFVWNIIFIIGELPTYPITIPCALGIIFVGYIGKYIDNHNETT